MMHTQGLPLRSSALVANKDYFTMSVTLVAAAFTYGDAIAHVRHDGRNSKGDWLIIGECSYCSAHLWGRLSRFNMLGCPFRILGDCGGQLLPITMAMDDFDYDKIAESDFMHDLCKGFRIGVREHRRGTGQEHITFMQRLYDRSWALESCIDAAKKRYLITERTPQCTLVIVHRPHIRLKAMTNTALARERHDTRNIKPPCVPQGLHGEYASRHARVALLEAAGVFQRARGEPHQWLGIRSARYRRSDCSIAEARPGR